MAVRRTRLWAAVPIATGAVLLASSEALAQDADHSDRGDVSDFREHAEDGKPEPYKIGLDGEPEPSWSLSVGAPILYDTNPFWDPDGSDDAILFAPSIGLTYSHPGLLPGWDLELNGGADADLFTRDPDELNEARLSADATVFHQIGKAGTLSFSFRARWIYLGESFGQFDQSQQRYVVGFAPNISNKVGISLSGEYRDSSRSESRRFIGRINFDVTAIETRDVRVGLFQEFDYSSYFSGANDGREDLLSMTEVMLTPTFALPPGTRLSLAATLFHRFSNRAASRFTAVQIGPTLGFRF